MDDLDQVRDAVQAASRVCFFAHYHQDGIVADHVLFYLRAIREAGFTTIVLSSAALDESERGKLGSVSAHVVLRENAGMDFGGWIEACTTYFPLSAELLLLANDSVYGPVSDLSAFIEALTAHNADLYGALETLELAPHLQSWFVLLRPAAYNSPAFRRLMLAPIDHALPKGDIVFRYEVGLTRNLADAGLRYHAWFSPRQRGGLAAHYPYNPAHLIWRQLLEQEELPFVKIELLRLNPMAVADVDTWPEVVGALEPALVPMIAADLDRRGRVRPGAPNSGGPIYWREMRPLIRWDHALTRSGRGPAATVRTAALLVLFRAARAVASRARRFAGRGGAT